MCFGVIKLAKLGNISSIAKGKLFGGVIRYVMFRGTMASEWLTNNLAVETLYKGEVFTQ